MLRKITAFTIAMLIVLSTCVIFAGAESISDHMVFNADYRTENNADLTNNFKLDVDGSDDPIYKEFGGIKAAAFGSNDAASFMYAEGPSFLEYDLTKGITVETYVYLADENVDTANIFALGINAICLSDYNDSADHASGFRCTDNNNPEWTVDPSASMCNAYKQESLPRGQWLHLVGVSDGKTNVYYINGEKAAEATRQTAQFHPQTMNEDLAKTITIATGSGTWSANLEGGIAFARMYTTAVTADEVKAMYEDAKSGVTAAPGSNPTPVPGDKPTEVPGDKPTNAPEPSPSKAPEQSNPKSFDIGIVALAAVSVSALAAVKSRKKDK